MEIIYKIEKKADNARHRISIPIEIIKKYGNVYNLILYEGGRIELEPVNKKKGG